MVDYMVDVWCGPCAAAVRAWPLTRDGRVTFWRYEHTYLTFLVTNSQVTNIKKCEESGGDAGIRGDS